MKYFFSIILLILSIQVSNSQEIRGYITNHNNQKLYLYAFDGLKEKRIDSTLVDANGAFTLKFSNKDYGMGYIKPDTQKPLIVALTNENMALDGDALDLATSSNITKGTENMAFVTYAKQSAVRENALSAWDYLKKLYINDPTFDLQKKEQSFILNEIKRLKTADANFVQKLPAESYMRWFLPIRKLVSSVSVVAQYRPEEIPSTLAALRAINYADPRLYKSGLFREAIENHVWFIENSSGELEQVYKDLNQSIDILLQQLKSDQPKFNEVADFLFNLLEKRSLFTSSEYLALKLLNDESCTLSDNIAKQMEGYRKMKKGNIAPNIQFTEFSYFPEGINAKNLDALKSEYTLVVFAAGWCSHCVEEVPKIAALYPELKAKNIEVVLVSLDENTSSFAQFAAPLPFVSTTDYKKWDSQIVQDYHVFGTPTYYLLNKKREIILRPHSVPQLSAYINLIP